MRNDETCKTWSEGKEGNAQRHGREKHPKHWSGLEVRTNSEPMINCNWILLLSFCCPFVLVKFRAKEEDDCSPGWSSFSYEGFICKVRDDATKTWVRLSTSSSCTSAFTVPRIYSDYFGLYCMQSLDQF